MVITLKRIKDFLQDSKIELILKGAKLSFLAKIVSVFLGLLINYIIANNYGAGMVGILSLIMSILLIASLFTTFGMQDAIIKLILEFKNKHQIPFFEVYKNSIIISILLSFIIGMSLFYGSEFIALKIFADISLSTFVVYLSIFLFFYTFHQINVATVRSLKEVKIFAFFELLPNLIMIVLLLLFSYLSDDFYIPIYAYLFSLFVLFCFSSLIIYRIYIQERKSIKHIYNKSLIKIRLILKNSFPMLLTSSMFIIASQIDIFMLGFLTTVEEVGVYSIANKIAVMVTFITVAINSMSAPEFSDLYNKGRINDLQYVAQKTTKLIFFTTFPIIIILGFLGKYILNIFGESFIIGYSVLLLLLLGQSLNAMLGSTGNFLNMTNNQNKLMFFVLIALILNIILNYMLIPMYGINGAAFSTMISVISWNILATIFIYKKFGFMIIYNPFKRENINV